MKKNLNGIGASDGVAIAKAFIFKDLVFNFDSVVFSDVTNELKKYQEACIIAKKQIGEIIQIGAKRISAEKIEIFQAHIQLVDDEEIQNEIKWLIQEKNTPLALAVNVVYNKYFEMFVSMEDAYFKERSSDIADLRKRLLAIIMNMQLPELLKINEPCIIVAHDLAPSETAQLDPKYVKGFLTNIGGRTSHAAIMARTMEIPAVVSLKSITEIIKPNAEVAMDGSNGIVEIINDQATKNVWLEKQKKFNLNKQILAKYKNIQAKTTDNHKVLIEGNIGHSNDVDKVLENGGESIGLFRSEFLYMDANNWPTEEEQYESYKQALIKVPNHLVIIRTLDIGGDKNLIYFKFPKELNPFLGYRALRLSLGKKEIFITQLRALLRASVHGKLGIMFPMVATVQEYLDAQAITFKAIKDLKKEGYAVANDIKLGMMIEIPTAAVLAEQFSKHADFFSIGSNDLIQYSMAVDRMSEEVNYLYQPNFPGVLKIIQLAIKGAHANKKMIGMCGEMAGEILSIPLLLGLGLDAFSMSASSIPRAKYLISHLSLNECQNLAKNALTKETEIEVNNLVKEFLVAKKLDLI